MVRITHIQRIAGHQHFAGEAQGGGGFDQLLQCQAGLAGRQQALLGKVAEHAVDQGIEGLERQFAFVLADDPACGVDEHQRRPGPAPIGVPDLEVAVVHHRVFDAVAEYGLA